MTKEELKAVRLQLGMTQKALAGVLGLSRQCIIGYEAGKKIPGPVGLVMRFLLKEQFENSRPIYRFYTKFPYTEIKAIYPDGRITDLPPGPEDLKGGK